jgi:hypothetical protein
MVEVGLRTPTPFSVGPPCATVSIVFQACCVAPSFNRAALPCTTAEHSHPYILLDLDESLERNGMAIDTEGTVSIAMLTVLAVL